MTTFSPLWYATGTLKNCYPFRAWRSEDPNSITGLKKVLQVFPFKPLYFPNFLSLFLYYGATLLDPGMLYWQHYTNPQELPQKPLKQNIGRKTEVQERWNDFFKAMEQFTGRAHCGRQDSWCCIHYSYLPLNLWIHLLILWHSWRLKKNYFTGLEESRWSLKWKISKNTTSTYKIMLGYLMYS